MPELAWYHVLLRLALAAGLGGAIGLERQLRERRAGLRTHMLVSVGSALFTLVSAYAWGDWDTGPGGQFRVDPTRIAAQIVSGIGFLGAGAIIRQGLSVRGLTTAATLWVVAAIGMAAGAGYYTGAVATTALVLFALGPLRAVSQRLAPRSDRAQLLVTTSSPAGGAVLLDALARSGVHVRSLEFDEEDGRRRVSVEVALPPAVTREALVMQLMASEEIAGAEWVE